MRQGNMRDITIDDVKRILRDKVEQTLKYIHHYHIIVIARSQKTPAIQKGLLNLF